MDLIISAAVLFVLLGIGTPVGFTMAIVGAFGLYQRMGYDAMIGVLTTAPLSSVSSYEMIAVPMFLLMAEFVIISGLADNLFNAASKWTGGVRGGLAMATTIAGAGFGAISGSSTASAATLSATTIPSMLKNGYEPKFACGVVAISGTLAMLIPPSVALILYGLIANVNIGQLLIAGVIPGILVTLAIMATIWLLIRINPAVAPESAAFSWTEKLASLRTVGSLIFLFGAVTGVIYTGVATPTEASAIGALGALILAVKRKNVNFSKLKTATINATRTTCMVVMIIMGAQILGYYIALTHLTQDMIIWIHAMDLSKWLIITIVLVGLIILGCFMDQIAIIFLTVPILVPLVVEYGFDPLWFGVVMIITAELGMVTPPMGMNAFVIARYTGRPLGEIFSGVIPHIFAHIVIIVILVAFPAIIMWLPMTMK